MTHVNQRNSQPPTVHQDARPASRNRALSAVDRNFLRSQFRSLASRRLLFVGSRWFTLVHVGSRRFTPPCFASSSHVPRTFLARSSHVHRIAWSPAVRPIRLRHLSPTSRALVSCTATARNRTKPHAITRARTQSHAAAGPRSRCRGAPRARWPHVTLDTICRSLDVADVRDVGRSTSAARFRLGVAGPVA